LLIPFKSPYAPAWVGLGILSFYLTALLVVSFYVKKRIGTRSGGGYTPPAFSGG
jgi:hypothetical protein